MAGGPKLSSVNILILNKGCPMNNIIPLPESPKGVHGDLSGPMDSLFCEGTSKYEGGNP